MIKKLIQSKRFSLSIFLFVVAIFCFSLTIFRQYRTQENMYIFLNWNLFLAFIPWGLSSLLIIYPKMQKKIFLIIILPLWLLFFPNTIYILTDIIHLRHTNYHIFWYDLFLVLSFALTGLFLGLISLLDIDKILTKYFKVRIRSLIIIAIIFVSSFGVYLGRFLRWNSWDIINQPFALLYDVAHNIIFPLQHIKTWMVTILLGILFNIIYWTIKFIHYESKNDFTGSN